MKLSICMMARNEEDQIGRAIESVKGADEIILIDTGSTDRTNEIAAGFGAKIINSPWRGDFSFHRNESLGHATGDWCMILDCDERLFGDVGAIKEALASLPENVNAALVRVDDMQAGKVAVSFNSPRFFRRGKVHYSGTVHNRPVIEGGQAGTFLKGPRLEHYGYDLSPEKMAAKQERTLGLLEARIAADQGDYEAYFYRGQMRGKAGDLEGLYADTCHYLTYCPDSERKLGHAFFTAANVAHALGKLDKARDWALKGVTVDRNDIDCHFQLIQIGMATQDGRLIREAAHAYMASFEAIESNPLLAGSRMLYHFNSEARAVSMVHVITQQAAILGLNVRHMVNELLPKTAKPRELKRVLRRELKKLGLFGLKSYFTGV